MYLSTTVFVISTWISYTIIMVLIDIINIYDYNLQSFFIQVRVMINTGDLSHNHEKTEVLYGIENTIRVQLQVSANATSEIFVYGDWISPSVIIRN